MRTCGASSTTKRNHLVQARAWCEKRRYMGRHCSTKPDESKLTSQYTVALNFPSSPERLRFPIFKIAELKSVLGLRFIFRKHQPCRWLPTFNIEGVVNFLTCWPEPLQSRRRTILFTMFIYLKYLECVFGQKLRETCAVTRFLHWILILVWYYHSGARTWKISRSEECFKPIM